MSKTINKIILLGNVGQDPDVRVTQSGKSVAAVSLATGDQWTDKNTGATRGSTQWHRVKFFDNLADVVADYVSKGSRISVIGEVQYRKWQDKNTGTDRYSTEIICRELVLLDGCGLRGAEGQSRPAAQSKAPGPDVDFFDDDIPF